MTSNVFSEKQLDFLRKDIEKYFNTDYRLRHTLGVEKAASMMGSIYAPDKITILRAAALLHDITKENSFEKQLQICRNLGIIVTYEQKLAPKTLHSVTAAALIPSLYPDFALPEVISAVRFHTTGKADMSITEKIIYLADYIEENRTFDECVALRKVFFDAKPSELTHEAALEHLNKVLIMSFDMTIKQLLYDGSPIDPLTTAARNFLLARFAGINS